MLCARWVWGTAVLVGLADGKLVQWIPHEAAGAGPSLQPTEVRRHRQLHDEREE